MRMILTHDTGDIDMGSLKVNARIIFLRTPFVMPCQYLNMLIPVLCLSKGCAITSARCAILGEPIKYSLE